MHDNENQRYSHKFKLLTILLGALALLISVYRMPIGHLGVPLMLLTALAVLLPGRFSLRLPFVRDPLSITNIAIVMAVIFFRGEAAVLLAAVASCCIAIRASKNFNDLLFVSSLHVLAVSVVIWAVGIWVGPLNEVVGGLPSIGLLSALCIATVIQAGLRATVTAIGESYKARQRLWKIWTNSYFDSMPRHFAEVVIATVIAIVANFTGFNGLIVLGCISAVGGYVYQASSRNSQLLLGRDFRATREEVELKENSDRFRSAFDYAAIGMALVSSEGRWLQVNRSLCDILGYSEKELLSTDFLTLTHQEDLRLALESIRDLLKGKTKTSQMEKRYVHKLGHDVWVHWSVSLAQDTYTKSNHLIFQVQDITDRKQAEQRLHYDAFHDVLTGLPNRALFVDHLKLAIARAQRHSDQIFAVLYLDLDRFKIINDSLGHMMGDQLLIGIARRLEQCLRPGDTVARLGGDEFTILIEDIKDESETIYVAERIQKELKVPFNLGGREIFTTVSIGIAPSTADYQRPEDVLRDADTAMYRAKSLGKARHEIFDKAMHARALNLLQLETDLRRAIEREEFLLQYQPIVALDSFTLSGFEALIRWHHPERGFISPLDFVPVAEETGLIIPIGQWVLREACRQMNGWQTKFPHNPPLYISINLSSKQFSQPGLINEVAWVLKETKIDPKSVKLEITESAVMDNTESATSMLRQLRDLGVRLSIDDFGTGYSSLSYLHKFPIDTLKIDRSFVTQLAENNENSEIVRTIIMLAHNLEMDVVAEGVETNEQLAILRKLGCQSGQGYFFSKPASSDGAEKIIAETYAGADRTLNVRESKPTQKVVRVA